MRKSTNFVPAIKNDQGEMPEWSIGAVSKTVVPFGTQGSNPCLSAKFGKNSLNFSEFSFY